MKPVLSQSSAQDRMVVLRPAAGGMMTVLSFYGFESFINTRFFFILVKILKGLLSSLPPTLYAKYNLSVSY